MFPSRLAPRPVPSRSRIPLPRQISYLDNIRPVGCSAVTSHLGSVRYLLMAARVKASRVFMSRLICKRPYVLCKAAFAHVHIHARVRPRAVSNQISKTSDCEVSINILQRLTSADIKYSCFQREALLRARARVVGFSIHPPLLPRPSRL